MKHQYNDKDQSKGSKAEVLSGCFRDGKLRKWIKPTVYWMKN